MRGTGASRQASGRPSVSSQGMKCSGGTGSARGRGRLGLRGLAAGRFRLEKLRAQTREKLYGDSGACKVSIKYDPDELVRRRLQSPLDALKLATRGMTILSSLAKFAVSLKLDELSGRSEQSTVQVRAAELRETAEIAGIEQHVGIRLDPCGKDPPRGRRRQIQSMCMHNSRKLE